MIKTDAQAARADAQDAASSRLAELGFEKAADGRWVGGFAGPGATDLSATVKLPHSFPDELPEVFVPINELPRMIAHVDDRGKVCFAPEDAVLLNSANPVGIVDTSLAKATQVLADGLCGASDQDILREFLAYWRIGASERAFSLCEIDERAREIVVAEFKPPFEGHGHRMLFAETQAVAERWALRQKREVQTLLNSFYLPFSSSFVPPDFRSKPAVGDIVSLVRAHAGRHRWALRRFWRSVQLPQRLLMSMSVPGQLDRVAFAASFPAPLPTPGLAKSPGSERRRNAAHTEIKSTHALVAEKILVDRLDSEFLLPRAGADSIRSRKVGLIVGVGAVGSACAYQLAEAGLAELTLVDSDRMDAANIHRHALGRHCQRKLA